MAIYRTAALYRRSHSSYPDAREPSCSCCPIAGLVDGLSEQIDLIREHQWDVAWVNHVHETFRTASGSAASRQRTLALRLSRAETPVRIADIPTLDADLGRAYANVTTRTLHRDIEALIGLELVVYEDRKVRAHHERLLTFLPWRSAT